MTLMLPGPTGLECGTCGYPVFRNNHAAICTAPVQERVRVRKLSRAEKCAQTTVATIPTSRARYGLQTRVIVCDYEAGHLGAHWNQRLRMTWS